MKVKFEIGLGSEVQDSISGLTGIVDSCRIGISGAKQFAIQPKSKEGTDKPEGWLIDEEQIEILKAVGEPFEVNFEFDLGDKVREELSGFEGRITSAIYYLNGCIGYFVIPKAKKPHKVPERVLLDQTTLVKIKKAKKKKKKEEKPPNGPSEKRQELP